MVVFLQPLVNRLAPETIFFAVGSMKIVKADEEAGERTLGLLAVRMGKRHMDFTAKERWGL